MGVGVGGSRNDGRKGSGMPIAVCARVTKEDNGAGRNGMRVRVFEVRQDVAMRVRWL